MATQTHPRGATILFDGTCNLCSGTVRFILANDPTGRFRFAALGSPAAARALAPFGGAPAASDSIIVIEAGTVHERSTAALRIARGLRRPWRWLAALERLPLPLRDAVYTAVARNRYRWFGRRSTCALPESGQCARFLSDEAPAATLAP